MLVELEQDLANESVTDQGLRTILLQPPKTIGTPGGVRPSGTQHREESLDLEFYTSFLFML